MGNRQRSDGGWGGGWFIGVGVGVGWVFLIGNSKG